MKKEINVTFQKTLEDFLQAQTVHFRHTGPRAIKIALYFVSAFLLVCAVGNYLQKGKREPASSVMFVLGGLYWPVIMPLERRLRLRWVFRKHRKNHLEEKWRISHDSLSSTDPEHNSEFKWTCITKVLWAQFGIMLYFSPNFFIYMPAHAFETEADLEWMAETAKSQVKSFRDVR